MIELLSPFRGHEPGTWHDFGCIINWRLVKQGKAKFIKVADIKMKYK
jgi:hypothetical protein